MKNLYTHPNSTTTGKVIAAVKRKNAPGNVSNVSLYNWLYKGYITMGASVSNIPRTELSCAGKKSHAQKLITLCIACALIDFEQRLIIICKQFFVIVYRGKTCRLIILKNVSCFSYNRIFDRLRQNDY